MFSKLRKNRFNSVDIAKFLRVKVIKLLKVQRGDDNLSTTASDRLEFLNKICGSWDADKLGGLGLYAQKLLPGTWCLSQYLADCNFRVDSIDTALKYLRGIATNSYTDKDRLEFEFLRRPPLIFFTILD